VKSECIFPSEIWNEKNSRQWEEDTGPLKLEKLTTRTLDIWKKVFYTVPKNLRKGLFSGKIT
jgi:hypothetical protein